MKKGIFKKTEKITRSFFSSIGGKLLFSRCIKTKTYSSLDSEIPCINFYVVFNNKYLFGKGDFSKEVYPRYRKMRSDWKCAIEKSGIKLYSDIAVGFVPLLEGDQIRNSTKYNYDKYKIKPEGIEIIDINKIKSDYYGGLIRKFKVKFALREGSGMLIGPEGGMLNILKTICDFEKINCFVDIGAGTGELSSYILRNCNPNKVVVNEISLNLRSHLKKYLENIGGKNKSKIIFNFKDCKKIKLPRKADLISIGVFYGVQPALLKIKGKEMAKCLGKKGILVVQSAMPETLFNQHILLGDEDGILNWPWYSKKFILSNYFSCTEVFFIDNQFIILASQSRDVINRIMKGLGKNIVSYEYFLKTSKEQCIF